ncbi:hypothetical protein CC80DRAFT_128663 [Byssothecium circinans]|uniref:Uncharacterized protein n=1 Tax=Byssothecium circinans TaxID=147558 RepID=A0A6A5TP00_9PLEO|nr:hypothetical protein CC80DRAFT_128663 [Byssothecium circinans]
MMVKWKRPMQGPAITVGYSHISLPFSLSARKSLRRHRSVDRTRPERRTNLEKHSPTTEEWTSAHPLSFLQVPASDAHFWIHHNDYLPSPALVSPHPYEHDRCSCSRPENQCSIRVPQAPLAYLATFRPWNPPIIWVSYPTNLEARTDCLVPYCCRMLGTERPHYQL